MGSMFATTTIKRTLATAPLAISLFFGCAKQAETETAKEEPKAEEGEAPKEEPKAEEAEAPKAEVPAVEAALGSPAPAFSLKDLDGAEHSLESYRGKTVVLEWFNPECPFVKYAHGEGPLKEQAKGAIADGVVWLSINSGGEGKQGAGAEASKAGVATYGMENPVLLDENGEVGHRYGAAKTPHMFVINGEGVLVYEGAIDNAPIGEVRDAGAEKMNYVEAALADLKAGRPVAQSSSPAYGCSVKYAQK